MKTKDLILSLIFPVICALAMLFVGIISWFANSHLSIPVGMFYAVMALFPPISVLFLKTDITPLVKWQAVFTALAAVIVTIGYVIFTLFPPQTPKAGIFVLIVIPFGFLTAAGITYGKILTNEKKSVLKWFTAFLSTPVLYFLLFWIGYFILLSTQKLINIPG